MSDTITSAADHRERVCVSYKVSLTMKVSSTFDRKANSSDITTMSSWSVWAGLRTCQRI